MSEKKQIAYIGIGSNLGKREENLERAIKLIDNNADTRFLDKSKWYENPAIEDAGPNDFLNGVIKIETSLKPIQLLELLQKIEKEIDPDRNKRGRKKARYIDLDILKYADFTMNENQLIIPHPRMKERSFVMQPLRELEVKDYTQEILSKVSGLSKKIHVPLPFSGEENLKMRTQVESEISKLINLNKKISIRKMYLSDIDEIYEIDARCFGQKHWSRNIFVKELSNSNAIYYIAEEKNPKTIKKKILGFIGIWLILDEMHIMTLAVNPDYHGKKIAEHLLLAAIDSSLRSGVRTITLEVRASNKAAQNLYKKYNFQHQGLRKAYYNDDKEDALVLWTENIQDEKFLSLVRTNTESLKKNFS